MKQRKMVDLIATISCFILVLAKTAEGLTLSDLSPETIELTRTMCKDDPTQDDLCNKISAKPSDNGIANALENYLGVGYNILYANPFAGGGKMDSGFAAVDSQSHIIKWKGSTANRFSGHLRQSGGRREHCDFDTPVELWLRNYREWQQFLDDFIKRRGATASVDDLLKYTGNADYTNLAHIKRQFINETKVMLVAFSSCVVFRASIKAFSSRPSLAEEIQNAVKYLPDRVSATKHSEFIKKFGTHVVTRVVLGSISGFVVTFSEQEYNRVIQQDSHYTDVAIQQALRFGNGTLFGKPLIRFTKGAETPPTHSVEDWRRNSAESPQPIEITIEPIISLLTAKNFPRVKDLDSKRIALQTVFDNYCEMVLHPNEKEKCQALYSSTSESAQAPPFAGVFQTSNCRSVNNVNNQLDAFGRSRCSRGFEPKLANKIDWSGEDCYVKTWMCSHPDWTTQSKRNVFFGGIFARFNEVPKGSKHPDGELSPDSGNPMQPETGVQQCPLKFQEYIYGKYYAWHYIVCLNQTDVASGKGLFGGGYQMSSTDTTLNVGNTAAGGKTECPSSVFTAVEIGHVAHDKYGFAKQYLCVNTSQLKIIKNAP